MDTPFLSELRLMSFVFPPRGWAHCDGQHLPINQNQALYALLGVTYGGDGNTIFGLPDLRGRTPVHVGAGVVLGERLGSERHTLTLAELPQHSHPLMASTAAADRSAPGILAAGADLYRDGGPVTTLHADSVTAIGGSQAHENRQPFLTLSWCIALQGIFPTQS